MSTRHKGESMELSKIKSKITRKISVSFVVVVLMALSGTKVLDDYSDQYTTNSIKNAAITYATARGINALISMLQTSSLEVDVIIFSGSMALGELLDPLNDLIERFSSVMTVVLGSLAAQKALLLISSHQVFHYVILIIGIALLVAIFLNRRIEVNILAKSFLIVAFIRFSLGLAVAANSGIDYFFWADTTAKYDHDISTLELELQPVDGLISPSKVDGEVEKLRKEDARIQKYLDTSLPKQSATAQLEKVRFEREYNQCSAMDKMLGLCDHIKDLLEKTESKLLALANEKKYLARRRVEIARKTYNFKNGVSNNKTKSLLEAWKSKLSKFDFQSFKYKIESSITSFISLMAIYLLKSIVTPLLFFYFVIGIVKAIWRSNILLNLVRKPGD